MAGLLLAGCDAITAPEVRQALRPSDIEFQTVAVGSEALDRKEPENIVIRTAEEEAIFRSSHFLDGRKPLPQLDFMRETGVFVRFPVYTGSETYQIVGIDRQPGRLVVRTVLFDRPFSYDQILYPWQYIAIPKTNDEILFAPLVTAKDTDRPTSLAFPTPRPTATP